MHELPVRYKLRASSSVPRIPAEAEFIDTEGLDFATSGAAAYNAPANGHYVGIVDWHLWH